MQYADEMDIEKVLNLKKICIKTRQIDKII